MNRRPDETPWWAIGTRVSLAALAGGLLLRLGHTLWTAVDDNLAPLED